jgi:hypothetical protein
MKTKRIVSEPVRSYLLGQLADHEASALEEKYFTDRSFFLRVRVVEQELIEDYLENRLPRSERQQFEDRYLKVPALQRRLEEVRAQWARSLPAPQPAGGWAWRAAFAACLICALGTVAWIYVHQHAARSAAVTAVKNPRDITSPERANGTTAKAPADSGKQPPVVAKAQPANEGNPRRVPRVIPAKPVANEAAVPPAAEKAEHPDELAALTVSLGRKQGFYGITPRAVAFQLPPAGGPIRFVVELAGGGTSITSGTPEIWVLGPDQRWKKIWSLAETVASVPANGGQELTVTVDSSLFHP